MEWPTRPFDWPGGTPLDREPPGDPRGDGEVDMPDGRARWNRRLRPRRAHLRASEIELPRSPGTEPPAHHFPFTSPFRAPISVAEEPLGRVLTDAAPDKVGRRRVLRTRVERHVRCGLREGPTQGPAPLAIERVVAPAARRDPLGVREERDPHPAEPLLGVGLLEPAGGPRLQLGVGRDHTPVVPLQAQDRCRRRPALRRLAGSACPARSSGSGRSRGPSEGARCGPSPGRSRGASRGSSLGRRAGAAAASHTNRPFAPRWEVER